MKTSAKSLIPFLLTVFLSAGCRQNNSKKSDGDLAEDTYIKELVERQIGKSNYCISIPKNYIIKTTDGPDFSVYYFYPSDPTIKTKFFGGFYFGNHPSKFSPDKDSCTTGDSNSKILGKNAHWTVYDCNGEYDIQTIIDTKSNKDWNELIHAFGSAHSKADLNKLLTIFTTMKKKK